MPARRTSMLRSMHASWLTFTTEGRSSPVSSGVSGMLPGAAARVTFEVTAATMTVLMRERLNRSDETTTAGRR